MIANFQTTLLSYLWIIIIGSGYMGIAGWLSLAVVSFSAMVVIVRHIHNPVCHKKGTVFYGIAHICLLFFLLTNGVLGFEESLFSVGDCVPFALPAAQIILSISAGIVLVLLLSIIVAIVIRRLPKPNVWSCFGVTVICLDFFILTGGLLLLTMK